MGGMSGDIKFLDVVLAGGVSLALVLKTHGGSTMRVAMGLLDFYKREISPALPKSCRFVPTCSEYARQAYKKYGTKKGFVLTAWRIMRCNPLGGKGYDPPMWPPVYLGSDPVRLDDER